MAERHRPFSCGSQYMDWLESNCCRCARIAMSDDGDEITNCPLFLALSRANIRDGMVSEDVVRRIGLPLVRKEGELPPYVWPCTELEIVR